MEHSLDSSQSASCRCAILSTLDARRPPRPSAAPHGEAPMNALRRLALATAIGTYLLIVVGAIVRSTGSGLGCPDWPLCNGGFVPPPQITAWIEFSHRF